jgi:Na+-transporting methylmalonyl-CoA/oxaloacetate decarboxylase gamma subunit
MLNALWIVMQFQFEYVSVAFPKLQIPIGRLYNKPDQKVQILGVVFLILFTLVLLLQFISMLFHRWGTIVEILASTRLFSKHHKYRDTKLTIQEAVDLIKEMELEKQDMTQVYFNEMGNSMSNASNDYESNFVEPDPDYDDDILPEPEPDYFDHPAVNNEHNWNEPLRAMSPSQRHHNQFNLNVSNQYTNRDVYMSPAVRYLQANNDGVSRGNGGNSEAGNAAGNQNGSFMFSPRQTALKPINSLDVRVMRQFRALEQKDPRFKRRVQQIRLTSPGGTNQNENNGFNV